MDNLKVCALCCSSECDKCVCGYYICKTCNGIMCPLCLKKKSNYNLILFMNQQFETATIAEVKCVWVELESRFKLSL